MLAPLQADQEVYKLSNQDQMARPFTALVKQTTEEYSADELRSFRSGLKRETNQQIEASRKFERTWQERLDSARSELKKLNGSTSRDNSWMARRRCDMHADIAALEQPMR